MSQAVLDFAHHRNPNAASDAERARLLENPGFGSVFTDHMVVINYREGTGWHDARVVPYAPIPMDPASAVLHYAQEIFEGLKAYRLSDGSTALFRPDANARRFRQSAERLAMPRTARGTIHAVDPASWSAPTRALVTPKATRASLYLRPFMIATEAVPRRASPAEYIYLVIASPAGTYFKRRHRRCRCGLPKTYTRAAPGGTGAAKCGGNYAASLVAQAEAIARGHDQVVFLDAAEHRWVEELGGMNVFFVFDDGTLITPPLTGTILPGHHPRLHA